MDTWMEVEGEIIGFIGESEDIAVVRADKIAGVPYVTPAVTYPRFYLRWLGHDTHIVRIGSANDGFNVGDHIRFSTSPTEQAQYGSSR